MKKVVLFSPYSRKLASGENPKNYPHWKQVVGYVSARGVYTIQIGAQGEEEIGCHATVFGAPLHYLLEMAKAAQTWTSIDNFFPHLCQYGAKPGVVIWGQSDPKKFGYPTNVNLVKDEQYLRPSVQQFWLWTQTTYRPEAFVEPDVAAEAILKLALA